MLCAGVKLKKYFFLILITMIFFPLCAFVFIYRLSLSIPSQNQSGYSWQVHRPTKPRSLCASTCTHQMDITWCLTCSILMLRLQRQQPLTLNLASNGMSNAMFSLTLKVREIAIIVFFLWTSHWFLILFLYLLTVLASLISIIISIIIIIYIIIYYNWI